jgi:hypothetical protein
MNWSNFFRSEKMSRNFSFQLGNYGIINGIMFFP